MSWYFWHVRCDPYCNTLKPIMHKLRVLDHCVAVYVGERCWSQGYLHRHQDEPGFEAAQPFKKRPVGQIQARAVRRVVAARDGGGSNAKWDVSCCGLLSYQYVLAFVLLACLACKSYTHDERSIAVILILVRRACLHSKCRAGQHFFAVGNRASTLLVSFGFWRHAGGITEDVYPTPHLQATPPPPPHALIRRETSCHVQDTVCTHHTYVVAISHFPIKRALPRD